MGAIQWLHEPYMYVCTAGLPPHAASLVRRAACEKSPPAYRRHGAVGGSATMASRQCFQLLRGDLRMHRGGSRLLYRALSSSSSSVPETMRALVVHDVGGPDKLTLEDTYPVPTLADGQVLVANHYSGVNFIDTYHRGGLYPRELPFICGQEGAGVVAATTPVAEEQGIKLGDRVAYSVLGAYCEYTAVPAAKILKVPETVGLDVANACLTQGLTAHYLTHECHAGLVQKGEWMLIHGVGSGACQWAAQIAKIKGYKVIGTTSTSKAEIGMATGVDELIVLDEAPGTSYEDYASKDIVAQVMKITEGAGVKCVIDGIGLATYEISLDCLARRGIFISFGNASGAVPAYPPLRHIAKSSFMTRPKLLDYTTDREELLYRANDLFNWIADGNLKVSIDKTFPLAEGPAAHEYLEAGLSRGKLVYEL